jgi:hypothetical protein
MSKIIKETLRLIRQRISNLNEIEVDKVCLGMGYTSVKLKTGHVGVCYTYADEINRHCCQAIRQAGTLSDKLAFELAKLAMSWDIGESVVGVAAINALSQIIFENQMDHYSISDGNFIDVVEARNNGVIALVGHIKPFIERLKKRAKKLYVFERNPVMRESEILPDVACEEILPQADIVIITGSSIANKTIDHLLELAGGAKMVGVVGASSSLIPDSLFKYGATIVSGIQVVNAEKLLQVIAEGGGTPQIKPFVNFINIEPKD